LLAFPLETDRYFPFHQTALVYAYGDTVEAERLWGEMSGQAQVQYRDESFLREVRCAIGWVLFVMLCCVVLCCIVLLLRRLTPSPFTYFNYKKSEAALARTDG
jgi:hypothetical protein